MKQVIITVCSFVTFITILLILFTVQGRDIRQTELDNAMTSSMEKAMTMLTAEKGYRPETDAELEALFIEALVVQIDSSSNLTVHILESDVKKGLLSAEAILTYNHPIGTTGRVSSVKHIMMERYVIETEYIGDYVIKFIANDEPFKTYTLTEGSPVLNPGTPISETGTFAGWKDADTGSIVSLSGLTVDSDKTYIAVFN